MPIKLEALTVIYCLGLLKSEPAIILYKPLAIIICLLSSYSEQYTSSIHSTFSAHLILRHRCFPLGFHQRPLLVRFLPMSSFGSGVFVTACLMYDIILWLWPLRFYHLCLADWRAIRLGLTQAAASKKKHPLAQVLTLGFSLAPSILFCWRFWTFLWMVSWLGLYVFVVFCFM